jgi:hypothetical protein
MFGTGDADADHMRYEATGITAGQRLDFSRPFVDAAGRQDAVSFRLAFAAASDMADAFAFACQRVNAPKVDRAALQVHRNGATGILEVAGVAGDPAGKLRFLAQAADASADPTSESRLTLPNALLSLDDPAGFERRFGMTAEASPLRFEAIVFGVERIETVSTLLAGNGVSHHLRDGRAIIPPAAGQGAIFVFEENS